MARNIGPKNKLSRREGFDLYNKGAKLKKIDIKPGQQSKNRRKKISEYGIQLRAKQRAKRFYGVLEKQFRNYVLIANKSKANSGNELISLLESRLDNVVFRLGLAPTRPAARQMVTHGHVMVNGHKETIPSFRVLPESTITISEKAQEIPAVKEVIEEEKPIIPDWLERDGNAGKVVRKPGIEDLKEPISVIDIIEFYSR